MPRAYQRVFFFGHSPLREVGLVPRQGVPAPTVRGFLLPGGIETMKSTKPAPEITPAEIYCRYCRRISEISREQLTESINPDDEVHKIYTKMEIFDVLAENPNVDPLKVCNWLSKDLAEIRETLIDLSSLQEICFPETAAKIPTE